jgi:patatin-like phospholipase/acyl hydrolase
MTYNVLSLDGGGIRGIITIVLLERLSREPGLQGFLDKVQFVAGTSTGGLIALGLAAGKSLAELHQLYVTDGPAIFADSLIDDLKDMGKLFGADYGVRPFEEILTRTLGEKKLGELRKRVLVTTFDLDSGSSSAGPRRWKPKLFHNFPGSDSDASALARNVALYTSAAPTYFPTVDGYIDGGVFAPNPSVCALAQALDQRNDPKVTTLEDVRLLSIGTGQPIGLVEGDSLDWGYVRWAPKLVDLMLDSVNDMADFQCRQILREKYCRLTEWIPKAVEFGMDEHEKIDEMIAFANAIEKSRIEETAAWIRANFA